MKKLSCFVVMIFFPAFSALAEDGPPSSDHFLTIPVLLKPVSDNLSDLTQRFPEAFKNDLVIGKGVVLRLLVSRHHASNEVRQFRRRGQGYVLEVYRGDRPGEVAISNVDFDTYRTLENLACEALGDVRQPEKPWFTAHSDFFYVMSHCSEGIWTGVVSSTKKGSPPDILIERLLAMEGDSGH